MSQLISIAERIKVITTIQKTAHAMQLISMSTLSRIKVKRKALKCYNDQLEGLVHELSLASAEKPIVSYEPRRLTILVGSQKGFCGGFNNKLFNSIKERMKSGYRLTECIAIGPYAQAFCRREGIINLGEPITYSLTTIAQKTDMLCNYVASVKETYDEIVMISQASRSIFIQQPHETVMSLEDASGYSLNTNLATYVIPQFSGDLITTLLSMQFRATMFQLLLESLQAENGARALSMDSSARNAQNILFEMKLVYNKIRQAKVTKELTELCATSLD